MIIIALTPPSIAWWASARAKCLVWVTVWWCGSCVSISTIAKWTLSWSPLLPSVRPKPQHPQQKSARKKTQKPKTPKQEPRQRQRLDPGLKVRQRAIQDPHRVAKSHERHKIPPLNHRPNPARAQAVPLERVMSVKVRSFGARRKVHRFHQRKQTRQLKASQFFRPRQRVLRRRWLNLRRRSKTQSEVILCCGFAHERELDGE